MEILLNFWLIDASKARTTFGIAEPTRPYLFGLSLPNLPTYPTLPFRTKFKNFLGHNFAVFQMNSKFWITSHKIKL